VKILQSRLELRGYAGKIHGYSPKFDEIREITVNAAAIHEIVFDGIQVGDEDSRVGRPYPPDEVVDVLVCEEKHVSAVRVSLNDPAVGFEDVAFSLAAVYV
jgi:hypothetical protein